MMQSRYVMWLSRAMAAMAAVGWMIFIHNISSMSGHDIENRIQGLWWLGQSVSIVGHLVLYAVLATLYIVNLFAWLRSVAFKFGWLMAVVVLSGTFAAYDEIRQSYIVGRYGSVEDVLVDIVGAVGVVTLCKLIRGYHKNRHLRNT